MSCEQRRARYWKHMADHLGGGDDLVTELEQCFQTHRQKYTDPRVAEAKTRLLFAQMQAEGFTPPAHSKSGLPRRDAQAGYAAVYDLLEYKWGLLAVATQDRLLDFARGRFSRQMPTITSGEFLSGRNRYERVVAITSGNGLRLSFQECQEIAEAAAQGSKMKVTPFEDSDRERRTVAFVIQPAHTKTNPVQPDDFERIANERQYPGFGGDAPASWSVCPQCSTTYPTGGDCPNCGALDADEPDEDNRQQLSTATQHISRMAAALVALPKETRRTCSRIGRMRRHEFNSPQELGADLRGFLYSPLGTTILHHAFTAEWFASGGGQCGWINGGCRMLADGIKLWLGDDVGLKWLTGHHQYSARVEPIRQHVIAKIRDGWYIDGDGVNRWESVADTWREQEMVDDLSTEDYSAGDDDADIPRDKNVSALIALALEQRYGRENFLALVRG